MLRIKLEFADMSDDSQSIELYEEVIEDHYYEASSTSPEPSRSPSPSPVSGSAPNPHPEQVVPVPFQEPIPRPQAAQPVASLCEGGGQFLVAMVTGGACRWHRWIACPQKAPGRILFGVSISIGCGDMADRKNDRQTSSVSTIWSYC